MKPYLLPTLLIISILLAACASSRPSAEQSGSQVSSVPMASSSNSANAAADLTRSDQQGAVTVEATPLNLDSASDSLEFDVAMNTHSVDLSMNLATLATLTTDTGASVQATTWAATPGGHHVSGKLIFPATEDGKSILEGARKLTLTILNVDAPSRVFEWDLK